MNDGAAPLLERLLPTLMLAVGVMFLTAGLLSFAPSTLGDGRTAEASAAGDPRIVAGSPGPSAASPAPSAPSSPSSMPAASATRIRIAALEIDLPVVSGDLQVAGNDGFYPLCDVALYLTDFVAPGVPGSTYIYAHAQRGMFLPLLQASRDNDGAAMIGALVEVYTADEMLHLYEIDQVKRHATDLTLAQTLPGVHQLVLQTSEGPSGTVPKLQVAARALSVVRADAGTALPSPEPRVCLPG